MYTFYFYSVVHGLVTTVNSNKPFRTDLISFVNMVSISNRCELSFVTVPHTQIRDTLFRALLAILNVNCWIILRSSLYDKWYGLKKEIGQFVCVLLYVGFFTWDRITRRNVMIAPPPFTQYFFQTIKKWHEVEFTLSAFFKPAQM